uniref:ATP synthase subunit 8 n=1 Tax=Loxosomella aloxiata TaxID=393182 RepID=B1B1X3_9BILA|nr:ATP synthase F0 subunit 8 [Loxosomella aloxiata]BAG12588.1 ATP synthase subunit 8 [Loxosomella aloxiata]
MPQLSPLNWAFLSIMILTLIFMMKVFFSFMSINKLNFISFGNNKALRKAPKWNW